MQPNPPNGNAAEASPPQFGQAAGRGFSWMSLSLLIGKVLIFLAQVVLGWILTKEEFGVLAIVAGVAGCIKIFQDGGVPQILVQRGNDEFERLQGAAFWISVAVSLAAGLTLGLAAPLVAGFYGDQRLVSLLWVLAATLPLGAPAMLLRAKLQIDLRFRAIAMMAIGKFLIRSLGMILLAWMGYGVMCFVIPLLFVAIFEDVFNYLATRSKPWRHPPLFAQWPVIIRDAYWIVFGSICKGIARNGDYLVLGRMLPKAVVGPYYFAYVMTTQLTGLIALNLKNVLFPVMAKMVGDPERQANAILRSISLLILITAPASMVIAVVIEPLESLIWQNKWSVAVPLMQIFALVSPMLILTDVAQAALTSCGKFRTIGLLTLAEAVWLCGAAWFAAVMEGTNITGVALWIFGLQIAYALVVNGLILRTFGITVSAFAAALLPQWSVALAAVGGTVFIGRMAFADSPPLIQIIALAAIYVAIFAVLARLLLLSQLQQLIRVAPGPIAVAVQRLFWVKPLKAGSR